MSDVTGLSAMMGRYLGESGEWVLGKVKELEIRRQDDGWASETEELEKAQGRWEAETGL